MRTICLRVFSLMLLALWMSGCTIIDEIGQQAATQPNNRPLPTHPLYVLTMSVGKVGINQLVIVDPITWQVTQQVPLLSEAPDNLSRDPQGRIWMGYSEDQRVQVFAPDGRLLKTLTACLDPYLIIHFAAGRAFISCFQSGFYAAVVVVDLQSLEIVKQVDIRIDGDIFLLGPSAINKDEFLTLGGSYKVGRAVIIETNTLKMMQPILITPNSTIDQVLAYQNSFLLLNSYPTGDDNLLIVSPKATPMVSARKLAAQGALWGAFDGNMLYIYHNAELRNLGNYPFRAISRLDLTTNNSVLWPLPDHWNARDIAIVNGEILLAHSIFQKPEESGLYRFDPVTGKLTMLVNIPGAHRILPPAP